MKQLEKDKLLKDKKKLQDVFTTFAARLDFVSITLDGDNPYKIFRSLNSTGVDLKEGDLIRNHVFMAIPIEEQDAFDDQQWRPLEKHFETIGKDGKAGLDGEQFTSFFRDVLMRTGNHIAEHDVYDSFETSYPLASIKPTDLVGDLEHQAGHHDIIRGTAKHDSKDVDCAIRSIRSLNATTAYPLVLALLDAYDANKMSLADLTESLRAIAGFVLRRFVCRESSKAYSRWFCSACELLKDSPWRTSPTFSRRKVGPQTMTSCQYSRS